MRRLFSLTLLFCLAYSVAAQYKVRFILTEKTTILHDSIYIAGTFNNWDTTANPKYRLQKGENRDKIIVLSLPPGPISFKFNRGNWLTVEKYYNADEVNDHKATIQNDTTIRAVVEAWRDQLILDKLKALEKVIHDTVRLGIMTALAYNYAFFSEYYNADSALFYAQKSLQLQQSILASGEFKNWTKTGSIAKILLLQEIQASLMHSLGNYPKSLELRLNNLLLAEKVEDEYPKISAIRNITYDYLSMKDYPNALRYGLMADSLLKTQKTQDDNYFSELRMVQYNLGLTYYKLGNLKEALKIINGITSYASRGLPASNGERNGFIDELLAEIYRGLDIKDSALQYYQFFFTTPLSIYNKQLAAAAYSGLANLYKKEGRLDSALYFAKLALSTIQNQTTNLRSWGENLDASIAEYSPLLAELYMLNHQPDSAYKYLKLSVTLKDSLYNTERIRQFQTLTYNEAGRKDQMEQEKIRSKKEYETKLMIALFTGGLLSLVVLAIFLYRNNKNKQKANALLNTQKQDLEKTLEELKATQQQLVQAEKMASLGELTAGIAHEIQNPLNFVNNFAELNVELIEELKSEQSKDTSERSKQAEHDLLSDISNNLEKITFHGKRADAIVKGMLQHSRSSTGQKEPTAINALADEYLRLAYHGLRARDKSFNAIMKTDFDDSIGEVNIIPQDIGRVILNLITNAFYAVDEKNKQHPENYEPTVTVTTTLNKNKSGEKTGISISVSDNGKGIPAEVQSKIFQPFFSTKPTGQGTGLGLSLSYDIIKSHGGNLTASNITDNENPDLVSGAKFTIEIPIN